jgi:hypothetical protein
MATDPLAFDTEKCPIDPVVRIPPCDTLLVDVRISDPPQDMPDCPAAGAGAAAPAPAPGLFDGQPEAPEAPEGGGGGAARTRKKAPAALAGGVPGASSGEIRRLALDTVGLVGIDVLGEYGTSGVIDIYSRFRKKVGEIDHIDRYSYRRLIQHVGEAAMIHVHDGKDPAYK